MGLTQSAARATRRLSAAAILPDARAWVAWCALVAWMVVSGLPPALTVPGVAVWLGVQAAIVVGAFVAKRAVQPSWPLFLFGSSIVAAIAAGVADFALPPLGHLSGPHPLRLAAIVAVALLGSAIVSRIRRVGVRPQELLVIGVITWFVMVDSGVIGGQALRDVRLYLLAGRNFLAGRDVYSATLLTTVPSDSSLLPFLYPPITIPFFAILAALPQWLALSIWVAVSGLAAVMALRAFGVRWRWVAILLLWPPFFEGLYVGNVAVPALLLLAVAPALPEILALNLLFKPQSAVPMLWLVRERRWRGLVVGVAAVVGVAVVTLPIVGPGAWVAWVRALQLYQESQPAIPGLYALALPRFMPYERYLVIAGVAVVVAFILGRGRPGLARLGIASIVASPSLFRHGFLVLLPGLLWSDEIGFWLCLGLGSQTLGWWLTVAFATVGTFRRGAAMPRSPETVHPLGMVGEPWSGMGSSV